MKIILIVSCCALTGCGPGMIAGATVLSGFDAGENLLHDGPDLFQCGHIFGPVCAPATSPSPLDTTHK